jgi:hypothetical protein
MARMPTRHSLLSDCFFLIYFARPASLYREEHVCVCVCVCVTHTSDCVEIVYELPLLTNTRKTASETILHKSVTMRNVDWIFIIWGAGPAANGRISDT